MYKSTILHTVADLAAAFGSFGRKLGPAKASLRYSLITSDSMSTSPLSSWRVGI